MKKRALIIFFVCIANFLLFVGVALLIGGTAEVVQDGKYFLGEYGIKTEVSAVTYYYSYVHRISIWITHPIALVALIYYGLCCWGDKKSEAEDES